ncbi:hypothetical protein RI054_16g76110 [Pseudoscourfieldia marina]
MTKAVAEFGLRFRGAVREFKNRGDPDDDNAIIIPDIIRRTNERASLHDRIIRANPENRRRRLALPVQGRGGGRNGGRTGGRGGRNTERFDPQRHNRRRQNANSSRLHTLTTLRCVMRLAARVTTQHVGAATPTQAAEVAVDEADIKVAEADEEDDTRRSTLHSREHYTPRATPKLPTTWSKYIVDNASPYTLTGSLHHLYDVQQLEKPKEIGGIKKDSTIECTHVGKIDFTTHEGTLTVSNAYYSAELAGFVSILSYIVMRDAGAVLVDKKTDPYIILTQDLYVSKILERFGFTSAAKSATTPLAHGTTLTRADEEDAEARHLAQTVCGCNPLRGESSARPDLSSTVRVMSHVMSKPPSNFEASQEACTAELKRSSIIRRRTRRTKHIEIRREFIKFHIGHETVKIERVSTKDQLADIMTKPLRQDIHNYLVRMILHG